MTKRPWTILVPGILVLVAYLVWVASPEELLDALVDGTRELVSHVVGGVMGGCADRSIGGL